MTNNFDAALDATGLSEATLKLLIRLITEFEQQWGRTITEHELRALLLKPS